MVWRILVIDDDVAICRSIKRILEADGYKVATAETGDKGLKMVDQSSYDLLLLDLRLGGIDGLEVLKRIKESPDLKRIPTVMLTVSRRDEDILRGYNHGCNSFIQKPVEFEKFVEVVKEISLYWGLLNVNSPNNSP